MRTVGEDEKVNSYAGLQVHAWADT